MDEITTTDFTKFGNRERTMAKDLLIAWEEQGLPKDFTEEDVVIMMNMNSGSVFLTNTEYEVAMINYGTKPERTFKDGKIESETYPLESFYHCPDCGNEGFRRDFEDFNDDCCFEFLSHLD